MDKLKSRKFLMALGAALFTVLTDTFDASIDPETYWAVWAIVMVYIGGEAYVDGKRSKP